MTLNEKEITFERGEDGNLITQEVVLETLENKPSVKIKPLTRGKLQEIYSKATSTNVEEKIIADIEVIKAGLVEPSLTDDKIADMKPQFALAISTAIIAVSLGITQEEVSKQTQNLVYTAESQLKKN